MDVIIWQKYCWQSFSPSEKVAICKQYLLWDNSRTIDELKFSEISVAIQSTSHSLIDETFLTPKQLQHSTRAWKVATCMYMSITVYL